MEATCAKSVRCPGARLSWYQNLPSLAITTQLVEEIRPTPATFLRSQSRMKLIVATIPTMVVYLHAVVARLLQVVGLLDVCTTEEFLHTFEAGGLLERDAPLNVRCRPLLEPHHMVRTFDGLELQDMRLGVVVLRVAPRLIPPG